MPSPDWIVQHHQQQLDAEQPSLANSSPLLDAGATDVIRKKASKMLTADNLRRVIQLPEGETEQDWITINRKGYSGVIISTCVFSFITLFA
jgi:hypothetical protein